MRIAISESVTRGDTVLPAMVLASDAGGRHHHHHSSCHIRDRLLRPRRPCDGALATDEYQETEMVSK